MTALYRLAAEESPSLGRRTLWAFPSASAEQRKLLAQIETGTLILPAPHWLYEVEVVIGDDICEEPVDRYLEAAEDKPIEDALPQIWAGMLARFEKLSEGGYRWVQLTHRGQLWAMAYMHNDPLRARRAPGDMDAAEAA